MGLGVCEEEHLLKPAKMGIRRWKANTDFLHRTYWYCIL